MKKIFYDFEVFKHDDGGTVLESKRNDFAGKLPRDLGVQVARPTVGVGAKPRAELAGGGGNDGRGFVCLIYPGDDATHGLFCT